MDAATRNLIDIYEAEWSQIQMGNLTLKSWTKIRTEHEEQMSTAYKRSNTLVLRRIEKQKLEYREEKVGPDAQTGGSGSQWIF